MEWNSTRPGSRAVFQRGDGADAGGNSMFYKCTALLVTLNRIYKVHSGLRFTGIDR